MSRRSSRLLSGGYYHSDEESDSSTVTNISYRENPVKVFKKKAGNRKAGSRTTSRANSNDSSVSAESPVTTGLSASPLTIHTELTMRTVPHIGAATPRPALTPSSSRSQTPTRCPSVSQENSPYTGLCSSSRPGLQLRPNLKLLTQSSIDSSGYSSSEGTYRKSAATTSNTSRIKSTCEAPSTGYRSRISSAFDGLMDSLSAMAAAGRSKIMHLTALANNSALRSHVKKAGCLLLLLLLIVLCVWFLLPLLASFISRMSVTKTPSQTKPKTQPVFPATAPPPPPPLAAPPITIPPAPVLDPAVVSAVVEAKMQRFLEELQLKQEHLLSQMEQMKRDLQGVTAGITAVDANTRLRLEDEFAAVRRQMEDIQTDGRSAATRVNLRIQAVEAQNTKLSQELSSIQLVPPPAPCPDTSTAPVQDQLTPELQQAMEKWLTDRIKVQEALRLEERGRSCSECGHPIANRMADFALETQGASVISTKCSETYRIRSACVTLFGFPLWYPSESPRTVIQGFPVLLPGKCWAFHGVQGTLVISLSHPIRISHVTLDHLPRCNSPTGRIDSAPKDFEVYGMKNDTEEGTLLGTFTYDEDGESTQTFQLLEPSDVVYRVVELRVLSNWGHVEYTCLYRFRVHGKMASA
ncbi:uncharacterized protein sun2 [Aulostomus maculatus]